MADRNDFVVPTLAGEPYVPRPPLAYMGGALSIKAFSPPLQIHNAARLIVGVALALVLLATAFASRELNGRALPLAAGTDPRRQRRLLGPRARAVARIVPDARRRGRLVGIRARAAPPAGGRTWPRRRHRDRVPGPRVHRSAVARRHRAAAAVVRPRVAQPRLRRDGGHCAGVGLALSLPWPLALHARDPALFAQWWQANRWATTSHSSATTTPSPCTTCAISSGSRGRRCRCSSGSSGCADAASTAAWREPGIVIPGVLSLVILASLLVMPEARLANALAAADPACAARGARGRFAEARLLRARSTGSAS